MLQLQSRHDLSVATVSVRPTAKRLIARRNAEFTAFLVANAHRANSRTDMNVVVVNAYEAMDRYAKAVCEQVLNERLAAYVAARKVINGQVWEVIDLDAPNCRGHEFYPDENALMPCSTHGQDCPNS